MNPETRAHVLSSMLLLSGVGLLTNRGWAKTQDEPVYPGVSGQGNSLTVPGMKVFAARIRKTIDVKRLKAGDTFAADGRDLKNPFSSRLTFVMRVIEVHQRGKGNNDSLLMIRSEKVILGSDQEVPVDLELRAIAAPGDVIWSPSLIITDHFGCNYEIYPKGCPEQQEDPYGEDLVIRSTCEINLNKGNKQPTNSCISLSAASGMYGFPDFSMTPHSARPEHEFAISSSRRNVHFEEGTYFVLSGPDLPLLFKGVP